MPPSCIVKGCKSRVKTGQSISFYRLPRKNRQLCRQWLIRAGYSDTEIDHFGFSVYKYSRMCSLHFEGEKGKTPTVVPTLNITEFHRKEAAAGLLKLSQVTHYETLVRKDEGIQPDGCELYVQQVDKVFNTKEGSTSATTLPPESTSKTH